MGVPTGPNDFTILVGSGHDFGASGSFITDFEAGEFRLAAVVLAAPSVQESRLGEFDV